MQAQKTQNSDILSTTAPRFIFRSQSSTTFISRVLFLYKWANPVIPINVYLLLGYRPQTRISYSDPFVICKRQTSTKN